MKESDEALAVDPELEPLVIVEVLTFTDSNGLKLLHKEECSGVKDTRTKKTPCSTAAPALAHLAEPDMSSLQAATRWEKSWAPLHSSQPPRYRTRRLATGSPSSESWGMNNTLPGRSRTDTEWPESFRKSLVVIRLLAAEVKGKQEKRLHLIYYSII
ncbi:hypothetical protein EYF80_030409 [Liparis tanakae]|uniref:Uncharacterized protein n=1 Tax=Liparis tanakae TaxID=230148 RepID=A0A4Z2H3J6_9TELE|nr:hypothetical protein EYF80_030409 [Liparis tanakae]